MTTREAKVKILECIINCEISLYTTLYGPDKAVVPISNIIYLIKGLTKYRARKAIKELISDGLIYYTSQGRPAIVSYGEYTELIDDARPPINGYALTKKGFNTEMWENTHKEWEKSMEEWGNALKGDL